MRQFVNTNLVRRNDYFGRGLIIFGLILVLGGFLYSFEEPDAFVELSAVLVVGIVLSQAGLMLFSRWGSKPRDFEILGSELRGFSDHHLLIHFALNAKHIFLCPGGVFNLIPIRHDGDVRAEDRDLIIKTLPQGLLKRSRTLRLASIQSAARKEAERLARSVANVVESDAPVNVTSIFVFLASEVTIRDDIENPRVVHLKQLKAELRKSCKAKGKFTTDQIDKIVDHIS
jgi:hypothetical protein